MNTGKLARGTWVESAISDGGSKRGRSRENRGNCQKRPKEKVEGKGNGGRRVGEMEKGVREEEAGRTEGTVKRGQKRK